MKPAARLLLAVLIPILASGGAAHAQRVDSTTVPLDDGTLLSAELYRPPNANASATILIRTPYPRGGATAEIARGLASGGYHVLVQSVRRARPFVPFVSELADGLATVRWIRSQPWSNGLIALWGASYQAYAAFQIAAADTSIRALVSFNGFADLGTFFNRGGAFRLSDHLPWLIQMQSGSLPPREPLEAILGARPLSQFFGGQGAVAAAAANRFDFAAVRAPVLSVTGWWDYLNRDGFETFEALESRPGRRSLLVGPWTHNGALGGERSVAGEDYGAAAVLGVDRAVELSLSWFNRHLRAAGTGETPAPIRYYVMGGTGWRVADRWPPSDAEKRERHLARDASGAGALSTRPPAQRDSLAFRYDPNQPFPTLGGAHSPLLPWLNGPREQRSLVDRNDVLVFDSEPFEPQTLLVGPVRLTLHVSATNPQYQIVAKLLVVRPDGSQLPLADGVLQDDSASAGAPKLQELILGNVSRALVPGSRLRLVVTGGEFPHYARVPGDGSSPLQAIVSRPVTETLYLGPGLQSRLEFWVLR